MIIILIIIILAAILFYAGYKLGQKKGKVVRLTGDKITMPHWGSCSELKEVKVVEAIDYNPPELARALVGKNVYSSPLIHDPELKDRIAPRLLWELLSRKLAVYKTWVSEDRQKMYAEVKLDVSEPYLIDQCPDIFKSMQPLEEIKEVRR